MALNYVFVLFILIAFTIAMIKFIFLGDVAIFNDLVNSTFDMAKLGFELSIGLTGVMTLWLGIMKVGEKGGMIHYLSKAVSPLFDKLFPEIPKDHPSRGSIMMNIAANMLGLDNAATPLGLTAMKQMQEVNMTKDTASNAQIMFLVLNTSGLTLIPVSVMVYRAELHAANPADVFVPILIATFFSTLVGIIATSFYQKINLLKPIVLAYLGGLTIVIASILLFFSTLDAKQSESYSKLISGFILMSIITSFVLLAFIKKVNVYETFIEGAKEGFKVAIKIIPYLVAMLVIVGLFRTAGALDYITGGVRFIFEAAGINTQFVDALPIAFMKPLSGSGARGMMVECMQTFGADSFAGKLSSVFQGSTDTTFYVLALYFGSVGIKKTRHAIICGLLADAAGIFAAILIAYIFFS